MLDQDKINQVLDMFFDSLKSPVDHSLETGLSQHVTIDILKQATVQAIKDNPKKFEKYVSWFLNSSMFLLNEEEELIKIE
jgi:pyruvate-formate lyase|tara:strand:- start:127 stop:366 length:240 start_codon:yes stop_codon:yes gene_type:complete